MTTHTKKVTETITKNVVTKITCDRCNKELPLYGGYDEVQFEFMYAEGSVYPGSGNMDGWQVEDICPECAKFLENLLKENEFKVIPYSVYW